MRQERISLEEALKLIRASLCPLGEEMVDLDQALGRTLARDVCATIDQPPFDRSPLDGYALCSQDIQGASWGTPVSLRVLERVCAGEIPTQTVTLGTAIRIMTGAPLPPGCDCVVRQEDTNLGWPTVQVHTAVAGGQNYVHAGEDYRKGDILLAAGTRLDAAGIGVLASAGCGRIWVYRRPQVALLVTGDEVVEPTIHPLPPGKIYTANSYLLGARLNELGMEQVSCHVTGDDPGEVASCIKWLLDRHDCLISTGGVSVGERDVFHQALSLAGAQPIFWRVQIKPGTPAMYSLLGEKPVLSLSRNPFAAAATFELLARPMFHALCPEPQLEMVTLQACLDTAVEQGSDMRRFLRGIYTNGHVTLPQGHSSGVLRSLVGCNCLVEVPAGSPPMKAGDICTICLFSGR